MVMAFRRDWKIFLSLLGLGERFQRKSATHTMYPSLCSDFQRLHLGLGTLSFNRRVIVFLFSFLINLKILDWPFGPLTGRAVDL